MFDSFSCDDLRPSTVLYKAQLQHYVAILAITVVIWWWRRPTIKLVHIPVFNASKVKWMFQADTLVRESYTKFKDSCYQINTMEGIRVLLPPKMVTEIKGLPENTLSATEAVREALMSKYTNFCPGEHGDLLGLLVRTKLGQNLSRLAPALQEELEFLVSKEFPVCDEWTSVKVQPFSLRTVARLSGRIFVGSDVCRNEEWMNVSINYAVHVFVAVVKLGFFPSWMRSVTQYLVKELGQIRSDITTARKLIEPLILSRLESMEDETRGGGEKKKRMRQRSAYAGKKHVPDDFMQWLLESLPSHERSDIQTQTELQLILSAASIHTTNNLLTDCILDLAAHPHMQDILREEVMIILDEGGWARNDTLSKLKKMDSFIKETQRLAGNVTSFIRKVCKPITLSDGTFLPPGTNILAPLTGVSHDPRFLGMVEETTSLPEKELAQGWENAIRHSRVENENQVYPSAISPSSCTLSISDSASVSGSCVSETSSSISELPSPESSASDLSSIFEPSIFNGGNLNGEKTPKCTTFKQTIQCNFGDLDEGLPSMGAEPHVKSTFQPTEIFDGLRYYKLRQKSINDANRWQFTSLADSNMNFGGGKHACPGRFFASCEIKTILAFFLSKYEIRLVPGEERPKSITVMMTRSPNPEGQVQFRRIRT